MAEIGMVKTDQQNSEKTPSLWSKRLKYIILSIILVLMITSVVFCFWSVLSKRPIQAQVMVNGNEIECEEAYITQKTFNSKYFFRFLPISFNLAYVYGFPNESAKIPMLAVLRELGAEIEWQDDDHATILFENCLLSLSLSEQEVHFLNNEKVSPELNMLVSMPGSATGSCELIERDILVDQTMFLRLFVSMGKDVRISWSKTSGMIQVIYVTG